MATALNAFTSDGYFVITVPESTVPVQEREEFVSAVKAEWLSRQSRMTEAQAALLADQVDGSWWQKNRQRILTSIGEA
jgi:hypothetical protein